MTYAVLGWGSLLWDDGDCPISLKGEAPWELDGPVLPIEFSRVSRCRQHALTLVIDPSNGTNCATHFAIAKRRDFQDVICDLRCREGTVLRRIGFVDLVTGEERCNTLPQLAHTIRAWAADLSIDGVVWTDLPSNFEEEVGKPFTIDTGIEHLRALPSAGAQAAKEYISRAPDSVMTALRQHVTASTWWSNYGATS